MFFILISDIFITLERNKNAFEKEGGQRFSAAGRLFANRSKSYGFGGR